MNRAKRIENFRKLISKLIYRLIALVLMLCATAYVGQKLSTSERVFTAAAQTVTRMALITQQMSAKIGAIANNATIEEVKPNLMALNENCRKIELLHSRMLKGDPDLSSIDSFREQLQNIYYADTHGTGSRVRYFLEEYRQLATLVQDSAKVDHRKFSLIANVTLPKLMNAYSLAGGQFERARDYRRLILMTLLVTVLLSIFTFFKWLGKRRKQSAKIRKPSLFANEGIAQAIEHFDPGLGMANRGLFALTEVENMPGSDSRVYTHNPHLHPNTKDIVTIHLDDAVEININVRKFCASLKNEDSNPVLRTRKIKLARLLERTLELENPELTEYRMIIRRLGDLFLRDSQAIQTKPGLKQKVEL